MKKLLSLLLCATLVGGCVLTGCNSQESSGSSKSENAAVADPIENIKATASDDKYRNFARHFH